MSRPQQERGHPPYPHLRGRLPCLSLFRPLYPLLSQNVKLREYTPDQADVIVTTLSNAGVAWLQGSIHPGVIAVDEAAKATEDTIPVLPS